MAVALFRTTGVSNNLAVLLGKFHICYRNTFFKKFFFMNKLGVINFSRWKVSVAEFISKTLFDGFKLPKYRVQNRE